MYVKAIYTVDHSNEKLSESVLKFKYFLINAEAVIRSCSSK